jgi:hypothetical protein
VPAPKGPNLPWPVKCSVQGMTLKSAVFLALIGTFLLTVLLAVGFVNDILGVTQGLIPPVRLVTSLVETFAGLTVVLFLYAFHRDQS